MVRKVNFATMALLGLALAEELPEVSVTATRVERDVKDVPASISIIGKEKLEQRPLINLSDAFLGIAGVNATPRDQGHDLRLIIRGGGLRAPFGLREIMVLINGVPITRGDGITIPDLVDTSLIERVEVVKGPNSTLWGINAYAGVVNFITKSPFERKGGHIKLSIGDFNSQNHNLYYSTPLGKGFYLGFNASRRQSDNSWREWNKFETTQITLQPSYLFSNGDTWENYVSYSKADLQRPGSLVVRSGPNPVDQWSEFSSTGRVPRTADPWKHMGMYTEGVFLSSKLTKNMGSFEFIPIVYLSHWKPYHPVAGRINQADTWLYGTDFQVNYKHSFGVLTVGFNVKQDSRDVGFFKYRDVMIGPNGRIVATLSDKKGDPLEKLEVEARSIGFFLQESMQRTNWILDLGMRVDRVKLDINGQKWGEFSLQTGNYVNCPNPSIENCGEYKRDKTYNIVSPRFGVSYKATSWLSFYGSIATGYNTPVLIEFITNPKLELTKVINYEVGLKVRQKRLSLDTALYTMDVKDEVVTVIQGGILNYVNVDKTQKKGFELSLSYELVDNFNIGGSYTYSDYKYIEFYEQGISRKGKRLPYIPMHQYSLFASYKHPSGFRFLVQSDTWGEYYMDNANSEKYEGYQFVTSVTLGYQRKNMDISLMVNNLFNERYANEVTKDLQGVKRYTPAPPRTFLVRLTYNF